MTTTFQQLQQLASQGDALAAFRRTCVRWPSQRPQKGRQAVSDTMGVESWAGADDDYSRALAFSPAAFMWDRSLRKLVELPALWVQVPLRGRDSAELAGEAAAALQEQGCPSPHFMLEGEGNLVVLWAIEPLRRPKQSAPQRNHDAFAGQLDAWRWAVMKLSFALEDLGSVALDVAQAGEQMTSFVPFPLPSNSLLRRVVADYDDPPTLIAGAADTRPVRIADISRPLKAFEKRLFVSLGLAKATTKKQYMRSAVTLAALEPQPVGKRHPAAVQIACASVWDGNDEATTTAKLRSWAAICAQDGTFPFHRNAGDELEHIVEWAHSKLKPGGPTKPSSKGQKRPQRTTRDDAGADVRGFLRSQGGAWSGSLAELAKQVALWSVDAGVGAPCPRSTLKRALKELQAAEDLDHAVIREGSTWRSTWRLTSQATAPPDEPQIEIEGVGAPSLSQVQSPESTWAPGPSPGFGPLLHREGEGGAVPPQGGSGGAGEELPDTLAAAAVDDSQHASPAAPTPEIHPRQRRLSFPRERPSRPRRTKLELPAITSEVRDALADVGADLCDADHLTLLEEARSELTARPRVLADFAGALRRRARRILKLRALAAASAEHLAARKRAAERQSPPAFAIVERRVGNETKAFGVLDDDPRPPAETLAHFHSLAAAAAALHRQPVQARARRLHELELSVVALEPGSKTPATKWKEHQVNRLSLPRLLKQLEDLGAGAGLAIVCGELSGVVVADFDDDDGVEWAHKNLCPTQWRTKTARGEHWFYLLPSTWTPPTSPLPWKGELRSEGHYVVAPGSVHPDGSVYEAIGWDCPKARLPMWNPAWLNVADVERLRAMRGKILKD